MFWENAVYFLWLRRWIRDFFFHRIKNKFSYVPNIFVGELNDELCSWFIVLFLFLCIFKKKFCIFNFCFIYFYIFFLFFFLWFYIFFKYIFLFSFSFCTRFFFFLKSWKIVIDGKKFSSYLTETGFEIRKPSIFVIHTILKNCIYRQEFEGKGKKKKKEVIRGNIIGMRSRQNFNNER